MSSLFYLERRMVARRPQESISLPEQEEDRAAQRTVTETMAECQAGDRENSLLYDSVSGRGPRELPLGYFSPPKEKLMLPEIFCNLMSTMAPETTPVS